MGNNISRELGLAEGHLQVINETPRPVKVKLRQTPISFRFCGKVERFASNCSWNPLVHLDHGCYILRVLEWPSERREPRMGMETLKSVSFAVFCVLTFGVPYLAWHVLWRPKSSSIRIWINGNTVVKVTEDEQGMLQLTEVSLREEQDAHQLNGTIEVCRHNLPSVILNAPETLSTEYANGHSPNGLASRTSSMPSSTKGPDMNIKCLREPTLPDLMNEVAAKIPAKSSEVGIQLNLPHGDLESLHASSATESQKFAKVFTLWKNSLTREYSWKTMLEVLKTSSVDEVRLAKDLELKLKL